VLEVVAALGAFEDSLGREPGGGFAAELIPAEAGCGDQEDGGHGEEDLLPTAFFFFEDHWATPVEEG
jgi:hypothetical protein